MSSQGMPYGLQSMLKDGHKHITGLEEAVLRNIEACKALGTCTRSSLGPHGRNKMVINHLDKLFVTSDAATIVTEMEIVHPAAKMIVYAAETMERELGDGTNFVVSLASELLANSEALIHDGLHPVEIAAGYEKACARALEILDELVLPGSESLDVFNIEAVSGALATAIATKQYGYHHTLAKLTAEACIAVCPKNPHNFRVDDVRIAKVVGSGLSSSQVIQGLVIRRNPEGSTLQVDNAKVAVYSEGLDLAMTETKGTVLLHSGEELEGYARSEEERVDALIKGLADAGVKLVFSGGPVGELCLHFCERYKIMLVKIQSKFELRRICRATGATALGKVEVPQPDQIGFAKECSVREIGGSLVIVLQQDEKMGKIATVVLRGATDTLMDDAERAIDDGINAFKALGRDARRVAAGGASEMELATRLGVWGRQLSGLERYPAAKFAAALEVVPRCLAETSGHDASATISALYAAHANPDGARIGVDVDAESGGGSAPLKDIAPLVDLYTTKWWALRLATEAATTVLKVDQLIMSKQAGGPKGPAGGDED
ncbi:T-complex protein 1 subunit theta [Pycnococcus provasolii]|mmetsp:Transcript_10696/g.27146  ORF Transcript_10696/g.27146 Transcript_10696/m.27146 type:complete len:548 (+) Transcript_10696:31-1674(+)